MEFSELALQKLIQLFPELANYIVTFKDITEDTGGEENSDIMVGVFILQFGTGFCYIPVIAKGEIIQPIDSIYSATDKVFSPLISQTIKQLISQTGMEMGKRTRIPNTITHNPSVYEMVTPPRTGKFVYASTSRLVDFLSLTPDFVKQALLSKFSSDKTIYSAMHKLFGLENILQALKPQGSTPLPTQETPMQVITEGNGLGEQAIQSILSKGYAVEGDNPVNRLAISSSDYQNLNSFRILGSVDAGFDYKIPMKTGEVRAGFLPKKSCLVPEFAKLLQPYSFNNSHGERKDTNPVFVIYEDGSYSFTGSTVAIGEGSNENKVLTEFFSFSKPKTPKDLAYGEKFAMFSPDLELLGVYSADEVVLTPDGVSVRASDITPGMHYHTVRITAYHNCTTINGSENHSLFVPYNTLVVTLGKNVSGDLEESINTAQKRLELGSLSMLSSKVDLGYDGIEFNYNGTPVPSEAGVMRILVVDEGIAPNRAENFVKQAKEEKHINLYMSKRADFEPGEIPQFGDAPPPQYNPLDLQGFEGRVTPALQTEDPDTIESTIISELLQVTNMQEYAREYLPDIKNTIDKIGRILFLARLNVEKLATTHSAEEISTFVANLRNVYRLLGNNYIKLEQLLTTSEEVDTSNVQRKD